MLSISLFVQVDSKLLTSTAKTDIQFRLVLEGSDKLRDLVAPGNMLKLRESNKLSDRSRLMLAATTPHSPFQRATATVHFRRVCDSVH
jgi:hypothetical protein